MILNLDIIGTDRLPLNTAATPVVSNINIVRSDTTIPTDLGDSIVFSPPLQPGTTYDIFFPAELDGLPIAGPAIFGGSTVLTSPDDGSISIPVSNAILSGSGTVQITPTVAITTLDFAIPTVVPLVGAPLDITNINNNAGTVTMSFSIPHGLSVSDPTTIAGTVNFDGVKTIGTVVDDFQVQFPAVTSSPGDNETGVGSATCNIGFSQYNENVTVTDTNAGCPDLVVTLDDHVNPPFVFNGQNDITEAGIDDNSTVDITVTCTGLITYTNTIQVYTNEETGSVLMMPLITDPSDPDYRRPYPNFFTILEPCTFNVHIYDGQSAPFGLISYEENGTEFSSGQRNYIFDTCVADIISLTQRIVVREVPNCGGTSPVIWDETFDIDGIQTTNFAPEFQLDNEFQCCVPIAEEITVTPELLSMNSVAPHDTCDVTTDPSVELTYSLLTPSLAIVPLTTYDAATINTGPLSALFATFTPDELGTYILTVTVTNCCTTITETYNINICESWQISNTDCNIVDITNISSEYTLTYTLKELTENNIFEIMTIDNVLQEDIVIGINGTVSLDLVDDGLYTFDLITSAPGDELQEKIFLMDCNIKKCKKEFLLAVTCPPAECDELAKIQLWKDYVHFKTLEEILYYRWDEWVRQQSVYPSFSINDIMEDVLSINDLMSDIAKLCAICGIKEEDCGCS